MTTSACYLDPQQRPAPEAGSAAAFDGEAKYYFSAPGRTEISGNQVDHQHGCVLAAAVNLQTVAEVTLNQTNVISIDSEGYPPVTVDIHDLSIREAEKNSTAALVRGVAANFAQRGCKLQGFHAKVHSTVLAGSGLSSSAAFEVLMATICNELFFDKKLSPVEIAQIGQWAENVYFGKPCGLLDQMASSVGGMVFIDFADPSKPVVERLDFDFSAVGHALCIIDTGADHAGMTDEYAAVPGELSSGRSRKRYSLPNCPGSGIRSRTGRSFGPFISIRRTSGFWPRSRPFGKTISTPSCSW